MDETILVKLTRPLSMLLSQVDININEKYIVYEKGIPIIYTIPKNVLYGIIQADFYYIRTLPVH